MQHCCDTKISRELGTFRSKDGDLTVSYPFDQVLTGHPVQALLLRNFFVRTNVCRGKFQQYHRKQCVGIISDLLIGLCMLLHTNQEHPRFSEYSRKSEFGNQKPNSMS